METILRKLKKFFWSNKKYFVSTIIFCYTKHQKKKFLKKLFYIETNGTLIF